MEHRALDPDQCQICACLDDFNPFIFLGGPYNIFLFSTPFFTLIGLGCSFLYVQSDKGEV